MKLEVPGLKQKNKKSLGTNQDDNEEEEEEGVSSSIVDNI